MATGASEGRLSGYNVNEATYHGTQAQAPSQSRNPPDATSPPSKRELASWWKKFSRRTEKDEEKVLNTPGIFGVPLAESIRYANVAISLTNDHGESFIYGYVPIVVAKCGVFLKEKATDVEGIFRLSGSAKRIKDLQTIFNSPDRYGKGLDWTGYTVHDAANILRRYLNQLPEPIVPLDSYERFRDPLRIYQQRLDRAAQGETPEFTASEHMNAVSAYQKLITELPALNRQLLLYILDLLAVFASKSDMNRMTAANLAAIFQPGIISHPVHDMAPQEYRLSQDVLIFLIENQDNFLIGMTGTAVDEQTQKEVESGAPSIKSPKSNLGRSASSASAGADSVRKYGVRRNVSVSSHASRDRTSPNISSPGTPSTPTYGSAGASGSLGRSNTVPSSRSPATGPHRFQRVTDPSLQDPAEIQVSTPTTAVPEGSFIAQSPVIDQTPEQPIQEGRSVTEPFPAHNPALGPLTVTTQDVPAAAPVQSSTLSTGQPGPSETTSPTSTTTANSSVTAITNPATQSRERKISNLFSKSPFLTPSDAQVQSHRQPKKLQKRQRLPGSMNDSAQSSAASLQGEEGANAPLVSPGFTTYQQPDPMAKARPSVTNTAPTPVYEHPSDSKLSTPPSSDRQDRTIGLRPPQSPTTSLHSRGSMTDPSDFDALDDPNARSARAESRSRWRFSSSAKRPDDGGPLVPPPPVGQLSGARTSNSSLGSSSRPRQSFTLESQASQQTITDTSSTAQLSVLRHSSHDSTEHLKESHTEAEKKSLFGKWKAKMHQSREERREREAERERTRSPNRITSDHASSENSLNAFAREHLSRGKSFDRSHEDILPSVQEQPRTEARAVEQMQPVPEERKSAEVHVSGARPSTSTITIQSDSAQQLLPESAVSQPNVAHEASPTTTNAGESKSEEKRKSEA